VKTQLDINSADPIRAKTQDRRDTWFPWTAEELLREIEHTLQPGQSLTIQIQDEGMIVDVPDLALQ